MMFSNTIYDSRLLDDVDVADFDLYNDDLKLGFQNFLDKTIKNYENRYHTVISGILLDGYRDSRYGYIGGNGARGGFYIKSTNVSIILGRVSRECASEIKVFVNDDLEVIIRTSDHDGNNTMKFYLVTQNEANTIDANYCSWQKEDVANYIVNKKKPLKAKVAFD